LFLSLFESVDEDINTLNNKISILEEKIIGFDLDTKKAKTQTFLSDNMNRLALTLDFEEEYRPINLNFGLIDETFDIYQHQKKFEKIYLYEMGSGANWVSCHIALFLSFLRYFATQEQSPMPLTMFFDQPSQVYFPQGQFNNGEKQELSQTDMKAVNQMYKTIFDEINNIEKTTGILPQILIVDHVDGKDLECFRAESKLFVFKLPEDNVLEKFGWIIPEFEGAKSSPTVSDGYWIMLKTLSLGKHMFLDIMDLNM
jgi:hypothetical protein